MAVPRRLLWTHAIADGARRDPSPSRPLRRPRVDVVLVVLALVASMLATDVQPVAAASTTVTFQEGTSGYGGTIDTWVSDAVPDQNNSVQSSVDTDASPVEQGLIRFDNIIGPGAGQVPAGATVTSASLTLVNDNPAGSGATLSLHSMLTSWSETDTWNILGSGVQTNDIEASNAADVVYSGSELTVTGSTSTITGVEAAVQAWVDGSPNNGWLLQLAGTTDGLDLRSSENGTTSLRPLLSITYTTGSLDPVVLDDIQSGTATLTGGSPSTTATIAAVDPSRSFLTFTVRGSDSTPSDLTINGVLTDATTITFSRVGTSNTVTIEWSVVEFVSGVTVQRGTEFIPNGGPIDVAISSIDLTRSFVLANVSGEGNTFGRDDFVVASLTSSTNLQLDLGDGIGSNVAWQVVQYNDAVVQRGTIAFAAGDASRVATVTTVDPTTSWLVYSHSTVDGIASDIGQKLVRGQVTDPTTLTFDRSSTGQTMNVSWQLVEFTDTTTVQHASVAFTSTDTVQDVTISAVDPTRSIAVGGSTLFGGRSSYTADDDPGVGWFTTELTTSTNLRVRRDAALAPADLGWFVIHWPVTSSVTVNSTGDAGDSVPGDDVCATGGTNSQGDPECTLRAAIQEANASSTVDTVQFAIPQSDSGYVASPEFFRIRPFALLPLISTPMTIDGSSQPEFTTNGRPVIEIDGQSVTGSDQDGLVITGDATTIRAMVINDWTGDGIEIDSTATNSVIVGNHIGLDPTGLIDRGNGIKGIDIQGGSSGATIGGITAPDRNIISGNGDDGIIIWNSTNNLVIGNYIGVDITGNASAAGIGNGADGIWLGGGAANNTIGQLGAGNVLSGNVNDGVETNATGANNVVQANTIGLGVDGSTVVSNGRYGVVLYNGANNTQIGGPGAGEGNVISGNVDSGVIIDGNSNAATTANSIAGNLIGTDATGTIDRGNGGSGIHFFSGANGNTIGGPTAAHGNVISGNYNEWGGVYIVGPTTSANIVQFNRIGTNELGDGPLPNNLHGIAVSDAPDTQILDNLISGNDVHGIYLYSGSTTGTQVLRNTIGTNAARTVRMDNGFDGIRLEGGSNQSVIGTAGNGNVISGNTQHGISINSSSNNTIQANWIGTNSGGTTDLGNGLAGVFSDVFGSSSNLIGGHLVGHGNTIAFNATGVALESGNDNAVVRNNIYANDGLGIDLVGGTEDAAGVTTNGTATVNDGMSFPVITAASESAGSVTVDFDLDVPAGEYRIDVFTNPSGADPSGYGEGEAWQTAGTVTHTGAGSQSFQIVYSGGAGDDVTLTATEQSTGPTFGSTSEFSLAQTVAGPPTLLVNSTGDASDANPGNGSCDTGGTNSAAQPACTLRAAIEEANGYVGAAIIEFGMPATEPGHAAGIWTIAPGSALPAVSSTIRIDASTQAGYSTPVVRLDGNAATGATGISLNANSDASEIQGLMITRFDGDGIRVAAGGEGVRIIDNWIGSDNTGTQAMGNGDDGLDIWGSNAVVDGNVVNYSSDEGIDVRADGITITGNLIGLEFSGSTGFGNTDVGIALFGANATIGGDTPAERNVISLNWEGIEVNTSGNIIQGNYIGTDSSGLLARGNRIGDGIEVQSGTGNRVGGSLPGQGNLIAFNQLKGVDVTGGSASILGNEIHSNGGLGIDVGTTGVTANSGADSWVDFPVITAASESAGSVTVDFDLDVPAGEYRIDVFTNPSGADPSGYGEGEAWQTAGTVTHTGAGSQSFQIVYSGGAGDDVTLTATEQSTGPTFGSTSEFSLASSVSGPCTDSDGDGLCDVFEALFGDTDGDLIANELDPDDDDDGTPTASENADPNGDGDPRDARDVDRDGEPDHLDLPTSASPGTVATAQKISETQGGLVATLTTNDHFGRSVAAIGDVDRDGVTDIAVGAHWDDDGGADRGAVYILFMNTDGTVKAEQKISDLVGGLGGVLDNSDEFGIGVAGLGDLDGDGINDIAVGSHQDDDGLNANGGAVFVLFLNADGTVKAEQKISETAGGLGVLLDANDRFGGSVANIGDLDGDGLNDLVVGAKDDDDAFADSGAVFVLFLDSDGTVKSSQKISQTAGGLGGAPLGGSDGFGISVAGLGDVDGDGSNDIAVGSYWDDDGGTNHGAVYVLFLNPDGTVKAQQKISDTAGGLAAVLASNDEFGTAVGAAGDIDADGVPDLIVGAPKDDDGNSLSGAAYLLFLNTNGTVKGEQKISNTEGSLGVTLNTSDQFGFAVAGTGDLDGDGTIGLAVGVYGDDDGGPADRGAVYVLDLDEVGATISGTVFEDIAGDLLTDGAIGSAANPGSVGVDVHLYDGGGSLVATDTTDASGGYSFPNRPDGTYTVRVDSATVPSAQDPTALQGDIWAEQTYGPVDAPCANGTGSASANAAAGSCFGGFSGSLSDSSTPWLHQVPVSLSGTDVTNIDFGFSFNVVTNTRGGDATDDDLGANRTVQGSLRQFIQNANAIDGPNAMRFVPVEPADASDAADAWWHIGVSNVLPTVTTGDTTIDGTALNLLDGVTVRNDNTRGPELELDGTGIAATTDGLTITGGTATIRDLVINNFTRDGIRIATAGSNTIAGNYIGTNAIGTAGAGNGNDGIRVLSAGSNQIGGTSAADRNVISGNGNNGLLLDGLPSTGNVIQGNYVGLSATGDGAIGNTDDGVDLSDAPGNTVGGTAPGAGNVISGQGDVGLLLVGSGTTGNLVQGNRIGTNAIGTAPVPNFTGLGITSGASSNTIGGTTSAHRNVISGNDDNGVWITGVGTSGNSVIGNSIVSNTGIGIDLVGGAEDGYGVTTNDPGDSGPNDLLDHPVITSATVSGGIVTVSGTFDAPAGNYRFEFFLNPSGGDGSGHGEGEVLVGSSTLAHTGSGPEPFGAAFPGSAGDVISATITEESVGPVFGSTSEFSAWVTASANGGSSLDSSVRRSDMIALGGLDLSGSAAGMVGQGFDLAGGSERLSGPATDIESSALTLSGWIRLDAAGTDPRLVAKAASDGTAIYELLVDDATGEAVARLDIGAGTVEVRGGSVTTASWHQLAATWDGTTVRLFVDGVEIDSAAGSGTLPTNVSVPLNVGNLAAANRGVNGRIDHVEISHTARSSDHIATAFANITGPASFVSMGAAQTSAPQAWTVSTSIGHSGSNSLAAPEAGAGAEAWATAIGIDEPGVEFRTWWLVSDPTLVTVASGSRTGLSPTDQNETGLTGTGFDLATLVGSTRTQEASTATTIGAAIWAEVILRTDEAGASSVFVDGVQILGPVLHSGGAATGSVGLRAAAIPTGETWYVDDARLRRFVSDEPVTSLGPLDRS